LGNLRILQVDAAIVRIMKTRKVLSHTLLITEIFQQVMEFMIPIILSGLGMDIRFLPKFKLALVLVSLSGFHLHSSQKIAKGYFINSLVVDILQWKAK
jgi:hypothetical protein